MNHDRLSKIFEQINKLKQEAIALIAPTPHEIAECSALLVEQYWDMTPDELDDFDVAVDAYEMREMMGDEEES